MIRHYPKNKLFNHTANHLTSPLPSIWDLPPYVVASFGGELSRVMLQSAERYIYEKSLAIQRKNFEDAAFQNNHHS